MNIIEITDFMMPELDIYARMKDAQLMHCLEPEPGVFIVESTNVILRALRAGYTPLSLIIEKRRLDELTEDSLPAPAPSPSQIPNSGSIADVIAQCGDIPIYTSDVNQLNQLVGYKLTGGIICAMRRTWLPSIQDVCRDARKIVILEKVMNPINVGSIFRSAAALNIDAVLLTAGSADPLYRRSSRVSMGTVFQVPWTYIPVEGDSRERVRPSAENPGRYVHHIQDMGFATAALALTDNSVSIEDPGLLAEEKLAIIMGTEGEGLFPETIQDSNYTVKIPMAHGVDSLNVAAASAIAIWQMTRG